MMIFLKSYTHKELQSLLVSKWKQQPGDLVKLQARIIGSVEEDVQVCKKKTGSFYSYHKSKDVF